jgi:hypothetical protein
MNCPLEEALPTAGGRLPRDEVNSKNVVISTTAIVAPELVFPVTLLVETALELTDEATLFPALEVVSTEEVVTTLPFPLVVALLVVLVVAWLVVLVEVVLPFPLAVVVVFVDVEDVVTTVPAAVVLVDEFELEEAVVAVFTNPGPSETAKAAAAAAANPPEPSLEAAFAVVPVPITVNLVQSSAVPRWATGIMTG